MYDEISESQCSLVILRSDVNIQNKPVLTFNMKLMSDWYKNGSHHIAWLIITKSVVNF